MDAKINSRTKTLFLDNEIETNILWFSPTKLQPSDFTKKYEIDYLTLKKELRQNQKKEIEIALAKASA